MFIIADMINDCCRHVRTAGTHDITLSGDIDLRMCADEQGISQVMINLVNNVIKYAPNSRHIDIRVEASDNKVKILVKDFGPGIPESRIPYLFDCYYQAGQGKGQGGGLGLGLYISASIIRSHGGEIGVDSTLGEGSTFWFTLPVSKDGN